MSEGRAEGKGFRFVGLAFPFNPELLYPAANPEEILTRRFHFGDAGLLVTADAPAPVS